MPNANQFAPQHTTGPSGTPNPDTANAYAPPSPLTPQPGCATPSTGTPPAPQPGCTSVPSPSPKPQAAQKPNCVPGTTSAPQSTAVPCP